MSRPGTWQLPVVRLAMPEGAARAPSMGERISLAVSWALRRCDLPRAEIAVRISDLLGERVSPHMLDGYASQSRLDHRITLERFIALVEVTGARELLGFVCAPFGVAAVPAEYAELIELDLIEAELLAVQDRRRAALAGRTAA